MMQLVPVSNERCEYAYYMMWDNNNNNNNTMRMRWYAWAVQLSKNIIHPDFIIMLWRLMRERMPA